jgi:N-acetyl-alpha-D-glucosaminyl L-malate synthase BshA
MAEVAECYALDLLHVHYAIPHSIAALLAQQMFQSKRYLPFVTTLHGTDITLVGVDRSYFPITKFSIEQSDGVTSISAYLKEQTTEVFGITRDIRVIRNFVNCDLYKPGVKRPGTRRRLLHISNFRPVKRVLDCVRILALVRKSVDAELVMIGDGPDRGPAEVLARQLGVASHVDFMGKQGHVERLMPQADVLLLPSELESFGLAALEGMACGIPPVATRVGGVSELVTNGVDGYLEAVGDIEAQTARVIALLTDDELYNRMAAAARQTASSRFCSSLIIPLYEQYYREVCPGIV